MTRVNERAPVPEPVNHRGPPATSEHASHEHMGHAAHDHAAQFRDRFWWSLLLAVPVVGFSAMFADLLGYGLPAGTAWISPVFGTVVFFYGGWPFLTGACVGAARPPAGDDAADRDGDHRRVRRRAPRPLGIGGFDLDFWWELALLIVIMLLGHWLEMRAIGSARARSRAGRAAARRAPKRIGPTGAVDVSRARRAAAGDVVLVRSGGAGAGRRRRSSTARPRSTSR